MVMWNEYYKPAGFSARDLLELERLRILEGSSQSSKVVYAPLEYWAAAPRAIHDFARPETK
jgi:hypothetical protein